MADPPRIPSTDEVFLARIQAAVDERSRIGSDIVLVAQSQRLDGCHCDSCWSLTRMLFREAISIGADVVCFGEDVDLFLRSFVPAELDSIIRETLKDGAVMFKPRKMTAKQKQTQSIGVKMRSYPSLPLYRPFLWRFGKRS